MMAPLAGARQWLCGVRPDVWSAAGLSVLLLVYSNLTSIPAGDDRERFLLWSNLALLACLLVWALAVARLSLRELGLDPASARGSAMYGLVVCVVAGIPPVAFVFGMAALGNTVEAPEITSRSGAGMAYFLLFRQPVGTALFEEVTFRGVLYGGWLRAGGEKLAFLVTPAVFSLWHLVITSKTVAASDVVSSVPAVAAGATISLMGLYVGGLIFAYLRWHTQSIVAPVLAHWLIVAAMAATIWSIG